VVELRERWLESLADTAADAATSSPAAAEARRLAELGAVRSAAAALAAEGEILRHRREELVLWAAGQPGLPRSSVLIPVAGGLDAEPERFYRQTLEALGIATAEAPALTRPVVLPSAGEVGRVLSDASWTVVPYVPGEGAGGLLGGSPDEPAPWLRDRAGSGGRPAGTEGDEGPALMNLGDLLDPDGDGEGDGEGDGGAAAAGERRARAVILDPASPWGEIVAATGGALAEDPRAFEEALGRLATAPRLMFREVPDTSGTDRFPEVSGTSGSAGGWRRIEVSLRPNSAAAALVLTTRRYLASGTPDAVSAVRARRLLDAAGPAGLEASAVDGEGGLSLDAALLARLDDAGGVGEGPAELLVRLEPTGPPSAVSAASAASPGPRSVRATVGVGTAAGASLVFHQTAQAEPQEDGSRLLRLPVTLPSGADGRVAVVVDSRGGSETDGWGAALASLLDVDEERRAAAETSAGAGTGEWSEWEDDLLPSAQPIRLWRPEEPFVVGRTRLRAIPAERVAADVARLAFFVDGEAVGERTGVPWAVSVDFGDLPSTRRVEVVAYDAAGDEIGRDTMTLNEGNARFEVRITEPTPGTRGADDGPVVGPVDVVVDVTTPSDATLERVDLYWNTERVGTRFSPPFRQRLVVPPASPEGFVRAVAVLTDGSTAEDVVFLNSPGSGERLEVDLVELFVVVTDRDGRPVEGLGRDDFRIYEEGERQEIATFTESADLPLTVGLAIDSSASMFVKLPAVSRAASEFVDDSLTEQDRGFVVGFGGAPRLAQGATTDEGRLLGAISTLQPEGQTALWEAVVYSLVQLQGTPGKKALIVYTDGADEDEEFSYRTTLRFARRLGVPIYVILTNNEIVRTGGKGFSVRRFLAKVRRLTEATGGRIYTVRAGADLETVYREIGEELRSQYLLAYYPKASEEGGFRPVEVEMTQRGLEARTVAGYYH
jgi:Ca-activated chloride channel family protein